MALKHFCSYNSTAIAACFALICGSASAATTGFTAGDVVVWKTGDGSTALSTAATQITLDEYTPSGTLVGTSLSMPTSGAGRMTIQGSTTSEGYLSLSADSRYVIIGGYDCDLGTANPAVSSSVAGVLARINVSDAGVDASTMIPGAAGTADRGVSNFRGYASADGTGFYVATASASIRYAALGSTGAGNNVRIETTPANTRFPFIYGGQLYFTGMSTPVFGVASVGTGLPVTSGQTVTQLISNGTTQDAEQAAFESATRTWLTDNASNANGGGVQVWDYNGSAWAKTATYNTLNAGLTANPRGLTLGKDSTGTTGVFVTDSTASNNKLYFMNGATPGTFNSIASAGTNYVFRGIAYINLIVTKVQTISNQQFNVTFNSSNMDAASVTNPANYTISGAGQGTLASSPDSVTLVSGGTYQLTWNSGSAVTGQPITITVNPAVKDNANNSLAGTTGNATVPVVLSRLTID